MNETAALLDTGAERSDVPSPKEPPGVTLTAQQRDLVECLVNEGLKPVDFGRERHIPHQTIYDWLKRADVREYHDHLLSLAVTEAQKGVQAVMARRAVKVAEDACDKAEGKGRKGKPRHPYQLGYAQMVLDRVAGKPGQSLEAGVKVPTEHGDVVIMFKSKGA